MKKELRGKCPSCGRINAILVNHHWYDEADNSMRHSKLICSSCNSKIRTPMGNKDHILPNFEEQTRYISNNKKPKTITIYLSAEYSEELMRICCITRKSAHQWCKERVIAILNKRMRGNPPLTG